MNFKNLKGGDAPKRLWKCPTGGRATVKTGGSGMPMDLGNGIEESQTTNTDLNLRRNYGF
jgi:hypothetical protein